MNKAKIQAVLDRKIRIKITRRKRGQFRVLMHPALQNGNMAVEHFPRKSQALTWLYTKLRCMDEMTIRVDCVKAPAAVTIAKQTTT